MTTLPDVYGRVRIWWGKSWLLWKWRDAEWVERLVVISCAIVLVGGLSMLL